MTRRPPPLFFTTIITLLWVLMADWLLGLPVSETLPNVPLNVLVAHLLLSFIYWLTNRPSWRLRGVRHTERILHALESGERYASDICRIYGVPLGSFYTLRQHLSLLGLITITGEGTDRRTYAINSPGQHYAKRAREANPDTWRRMDALRHEKEVG